MTNIENTRSVTVHSVPVTGKKEKILKTMQPNPKSWYLIYVRNSSYVKALWQNIVQSGGGK